MNQKLKFALATVITLLAVLWISYCVFCGFIYLKGSTYGDEIMWRAGIITACVFVLLAASFIGAQLIKATDHHFAKYIVWERIFMFVLCPAMALGAGYFYSHFFTVHAQSKKAETSFVESVKAAKDIFPNYRGYAEARINNYTARLDNDSYTAKNKVRVLKIRLLPSALNDVERQCTTWIKDVDKKVTVWNPFLLGNIPQIKKGINEWKTKLMDFSNFQMADEDDVAEFNGEETCQKVISGLETTQSIYSEWKTPNFGAIFTFILCYALLMFVYIIQERNTRNLHTLFTSPRKVQHEDSTPITTKKIKKSDSIIGDF